MFKNVVLTSRLLRRLFFGAMALTASITHATAYATVATGSMANARSQHTASLMADGRVMVVGGRNFQGSVAQNEIYNPATRTWSAASTLIAARVNHAAVVLAGGDQVLIIGGTVGREGFAGYVTTTTVELCGTQPNTVCTPVVPMRPVGYSGAAPHAVLLGNGNVLVASRNNATSSYFDLIDVASNTRTPISAPANITYDLLALLATPDGSVQLFYQGNQVVSQGGVSLAYVNQFNSTNNTWSAASVVGVQNGSPVLLPRADNAVLWVGLYDAGSAIATPPYTAWASLPGAGNYNAQAGARVAASSATRVAVIGGITGGTPDNKIAVYNPTTRVWSQDTTPEASMLTRRVSHTATTLLNGDILIAGGDAINVPGQNSAELLQAPTILPTSLTIALPRAQSNFVNTNFAQAFNLRTTNAQGAVVGATVEVSVATVNGATATCPPTSNTGADGSVLIQCRANGVEGGPYNITFKVTGTTLTDTFTATNTAIPAVFIPPVTPQTISNLAGTANTTGGGVVNGVPLTGRTFNTANVITDRDGNIFFTNADGLIYCISGRSGLLFTIGGIGSATLGINGFGGDGGLATLASFNNPTGLVFDAAGNLYIADTGNNRVRRINLVTGIVTTIAGGGASVADNIQGSTALLTAPRSLAFGPDGLLYIADGANRIRRLNVVTGVLSFFAGTGVAGYGGDNGAALSAVFSDIYYITFDFQGNLFIVDRGNNRIRCINRAGIVLPVAGTGAIGFGGDGGLATSALFRDIRSIAFDYFGQLYISDAGNNRIRRLNLLTGLISTFNVNNATFNPYGLYFDALGSLYTAELGLLRAVRFIDNPGFAFSFPTRARIAAGTTALSDVRSFTGFTGTVSLSIEGGEYNIGCSAANPFVSGITSLTISNPPQTVCLRVTAGSAAGDARTANFRVNNTSSPFTVLTLDPDLLPRYRIYVPSLRRHLYTTDTNEYNVLTGFSATYNGEGINHYLYRAPVNRAAQTAIPYYRMFFKPQQRHFYTSDFNEYNAIRANTAFASDEGTTGYIFPKYGVPGTTALYRLYNAAINSHLWTIDSNEFNFLRNNGWTAEGQPGNAAGVDGYVFP